MFGLPLPFGAASATTTVEPLTDHELAVNKFVTAAAKGDLEQIKSMWENDNEINPESIDEIEITISNRRRNKKVRALTAAAEKGHSEIVQFLIEECKSALLVPLDVDPYPSPMAVRAPMFDSIRNGHENCVRLFLEYGWTPQLEGSLVPTLTSTEVGINAKSSAIEHAATYGQLNILKLLLEGNVESTTTGTEWEGKGLWAPLILPKTTHFNSSDKLMSSPSGSKYEPRFSHLTYRSKLLFSSMQKRKNEPMTEYLVDCVGISINTLKRSEADDKREKLSSSEEPTDNDLEAKMPMTPFALAMMTGNEVILKFIVKRVSEIDWVNFRSFSAVVPGRTVIHEFAFIGKLRTSSYQDGDTDFLHLFLHEGADASPFDSELSTPLHLTFDEHCVRMLMDAGADATAKNKNGYSILHPSSESLGRMRPITVTQELLDGIKAKLAAGGPLLACATDNDGCSALLRFAEEVDSVAIYQILLAAAQMASPSSDRLHPVEVDSMNRTVLHYAIDSPLSHNNNNNIVPQVNLVSYLISGGHCKPSDVDDKGRTALHLARWRGFDELVNNGWSPNQKDKDGWAPLHTLVRALEEDSSNNFLLTCIKQNLFSCCGVPITLLQRYPSSVSLLDASAVDYLKSYRATMELSTIPSLLVPLDPSIADPAGRTLAHMLIDIPITLEYEPVAKTVDEIFTVLALTHVCLPVMPQSFTIVTNNAGLTPLELATQNRSELVSTLTHISQFIDDFIKGVKGELF